MQKLYLPPMYKNFSSGFEIFPDFSLEPPIILAYWPIRGRGEPLRLLAELLNLNYTEKLYTNGNEWFE